MSNTKNAIARNAVKKVASTEMLTEEFHRDIYELNEEVIESEEWTMPEEEIQNGLTIVVIGGLIRK